MAEIKITRRRNWIGLRRVSLLAGLFLLVAGFRVLGIGPGDLLPSEAGLRLAGRFFRAAFRPAFDYQGEVPAGIDPFWMKVWDSLWLTFRYALSAISLALLVGIVLGTLGARSWWPSGGGSRGRKMLNLLRWSARGLATGMRSVHELLWAILFLTALGTSPLAAVFAIALPYGGTLAKVFSEMLDEQDEGAMQVVRAGGGDVWGTWLVGVVTRALPDLFAYLMYRLECAIRSSAVLGFLGFPTIGYHLSTAYQDGHYEEVWTFLYALILVVVLLERWGFLVRRHLVEGGRERGAARAEDDVAVLKKKRSRSWFLRLSGLAALLLVTVCWLSEERWTSDLPKEQRAENLTRFFHEIVPYPVQQSGNWADALPWLGGHLWPEGLDALHRTFHLGSSAILLATGLTLLLLPWSSRAMAGERVLGVWQGCSAWIWLRKGVGLLIRFAAVVGRSLPEYVVAFLLLQIFGPSAWPLVLALAFHNWGILTRLNGEVMENHRCAGAEVDFATGASRWATFAGGWFACGFNRVLLFLFYRWETCIREATILGMLGVSSLGLLIRDARLSHYYDDLLLFVALGALLVFAGDVVSDVLRSRLRGRN